MLSNKILFFLISFFSNFIILHKLENTIRNKYDKHIKALENRKELIIKDIQEKSSLFEKSFQFRKNDMSLEIENKIQIGKINLTNLFKKREKRIKDEIDQYRKYKISFINKKIKEVEKIEI